MRKTATLGIVTIACVLLFGCGSSEQGAEKPVESAADGADELILGVPADELVPAQFDTVIVPEPIHSIGDSIKIEPTGIQDIGVLPITVVVTGVEWYHDLEGVEDDVPGAIGPFAVIMLEWTNRSEDVVVSANEVLGFNLHADPSTFGTGGYDVSTDTYNPDIYTDHFQIQQGAHQDVPVAPGETQEVVLVTDMEGERKELGLFVFITHGSYRPIALVEI